MAQEFIKKQTYIWHDLTVDPTDTPKDNRYYFIMGKDDVDTFCYDTNYDYEAYFCGTHWEKNDYDEDCNIEYFRSYGLEPEGTYLETEDFKFEVLAWAEPVKEEYDTFVPKLMEK